MTVEAVWKNLVARRLKYGRTAPEGQCAYKVRVVECIDRSWRGTSVFADAQRNPGVGLSRHSLAQVFGNTASRFSGRRKLENRHQALRKSVHRSRSAFGRLAHLSWRGGSGFPVRLQDPRQPELKC